ncbi:keratinocyte-associated protein 3 [Calypte anna]|uniref:keratinocyte-associated protein 3 n=1 Tax=Calypte anna TaxID=9244 RepID=UPI0004BECBAC|nr:keratinocyte-associated protein 3 [Calypte anna]
MALVRGGPAALGDPRRLMRSGLWLIVLGHGSLALGAIVHGSVLRHVAGAARAVTPEYAVANVVSVAAGLLSIAVGIVAILVSHNLSRAALHWALLSMSLLSCLLSAACSVGLALAIALTVHSRGTHLLWGCHSPALPADVREAIATNDCPFNTTRIYDTALVLWLPSMVLVAAEAVLSGRCFLVALIFQGIGPCAHNYNKEQLAGPSAVKERPPREMQQLLRGMAETHA